MATKAQLFNALLTSQRASGVTLSGGKAYFYVPGSVTLKAIYTDRDKQTPAANPVVLDSNGQASVYGDGLYDIQVTNATGSVSLPLWEDVSIADISTGNASVSNYATLEAAVSAIGATPTTLTIDAAQTVANSLTIPATLQLDVVNGAIITVASGKILTINSPFDAPLTQVFEGPGTVAGLQTVRQEWFSTLQAAINAAVSGGTVTVANGTTTVTVALTVTKPLTINGDGTVYQSTATENCFTVTSDGVVFDGLTITGNNILTRDNLNAGILFYATKLAQRANGVVRNCTISGSVWGVSALWNNGLVVDNCTMTNVHVGVYGGVTDINADQNDTGNQSYIVTDCTITCTWGVLIYSRPVWLPGCAGYYRVENCILRGGGMAVEATLTASTLTIVSRVFIVANDADTPLSVGVNAKITNNTIDLDNAPVGRGLQAGFYQAIECGSFSLVQGNTVRKYPNAVGNLQPHMVIDSNRFISCGLSSVGSGGVLFVNPDFITATGLNADLDMNMQITNNSFTDTGADVAEIFVQWGALHAYKIKNIIIAHNISANAASEFLLAFGVVDSTIKDNIIKNAQKSTSAADKFAMRESGCAGNYYEGNTFINTLGGGVGMTTAMAVDTSAIVGFQNIRGMRDGYGFLSNAYTFKASAPFYFYDGVPVSFAPVYADNATALAGGLVAGQAYRTATGAAMIVYTP